MLALLLASAFAPQGPGPSTAPVVINEFCYDDTGTDDKEFLELYNRTNAPIDISGWSIVGSDPSGANGPGVVIPASTILAPGGYWVIAGSTSTTVTTANQITTLAQNSLWENDNEALDLLDLSATVIDSVAWETGRGAWGPHPREGTGLWGDMATLDAFPQTYQRRVDGFDSDDNGIDFSIMAWTPGAANGSAQNLTPGYTNSFDAVAGTLLTGDFNYSFVSARTADPAAIVNSGTNTIALPPSPQGGNVGILHDTTGGGNSVYLRIGASQQFLVETYAYVLGGNPVFAAPGVAGEGEAWAIGVTGTTDGGANPADVGGYWSQIQCTGLRPGGTGLAWMCFVQQTQANIYLVDLNNGGAGATVLAGPIVATPGVNDGWQRLRIRIDNGNLVANFGGTFGADDGQRFTASGFTNYGGTVYLQYRECVAVNTNMTPMAIDQLEVYGIVPFGVTTGGVGSPTTVGTPNLGTSGGDPVLGNSAFQFDVSGHVPSNVGALLIGIGSLGAGTPVVGAPGTVNIYVSPISTVLLFANVSGNASYSLPLPNNNALAGLPLTAQSVDMDFALPYAVPIGCSQGLVATIGN